MVDFSIIQKLGSEEKYSSQKNEYRVQFAPKATSDIVAESDEVLTNTVIIHFATNDHNLAYKVIRKNSDGEDVEELYDPNIDFVLEEIAKLVAQFGASRVIVEGHTDASIKSVLPDDTLVKQLAGYRANAVKESLVERFQLDPNQLNSSGVGWDRPADPQDPGNHAKNRRVEIRVFSAEAE